MAQHPIQPGQGGTGVLNTDTLTLSGGGITLTVTGTTNVTLPTSGTLLTSATGVSSFNTRNGAVVLSLSDVTTALAYTPVNSAGDTMTGFLTLSADPTAALHAATKQYVDNVANGMNVHLAARAATVSALVATYNNGASGVGATLTNNDTQVVLTVDSISVNVNDRVLVKNQGDQTQNGIYVVTDVGSVSTNWILTRATDFDNTPTGEVTAGDSLFVQEGSQATSQWVQVTPGTITIGTSNIVFTQFGGPGAYSAGTGLALVGTTFSNTGVLSVTGTSNRITSTPITGSVVVDISPSYVGQASITTIGTLTTGTVPVARVSGLATSATTDTTNATNISTGTISALRLPALSVTGDATGTGTSGTGSIPLTLVSTTVTPGSYTSADITVDSKGRITAASNGAGGSGTVTSVAVSGSNGIGVGGSPITSSGTISLSLGAITPTSVVATGTIQASNFAAGASVSGTNTGNQTITLTGDVTGSGTASFTTTLAASGVSAGSYSNANITVDTKGRLTAASNGSPGGTVTSVAATQPSQGLTISGSPITTSGTLTFALANDLAALEGLGTTGYARRTGTDSWTLDSTVPVGSVSGLASIATSGSASDLSSGTVPSGRLTGTYAIDISGTAAAATTATSATSATTATTANALNTGNNYQINSLGVGTAPSGTAGEIRATNDVTAYYSDIRLKQVIKCIDNPLDKINSLTGFYYKANEVAQSLGYTDEVHIGVSAQDVEAILPELIRPAPIDPQYMTLDYSKLVPVLIEAIKELTARVKQLENK